MPETASVPTNRIDIARALKLRIQGNTLLEIADIFGVSESAVCQSLKRFENFLKDAQQGDLTAYTEERKSILNLAESKLLASVLDDKAIAKAPLAARTMAFGVLYDKRRLEEGKSTENLGILGKLIVGSEDELGKPTKPVNRVETLSMDAQKGSALSTGDHNDTPQQVDKPNADPA